MKPLMIECVIAKTVKIGMTSAHEIANSIARLRADVSLSHNLVDGSAWTGDRAEIVTRASK